MQPLNATQPVRSNLLVKSCFIIGVGSSYETRARFVSLVCSGWSLEPGRSRIGMTSAWSVKWWAGGLPYGNRGAGRRRGWRCCRSW